MEWLTDVPFAHRGLHDLGAGCPENSIAAIAAAAHSGYGVELDVHLASRGAVAVFHDPALQRMCGVAGRIADQDRDALRRLRLAGTTECVPLLDEALELIAGRVPVLIELKTPPGTSHAALSTAIRDRLRGYDGAAAVIGFDPRPLAWFRRHAPGVQRGQLAGSRRVRAARRAAAEVGLSRWQQLALEWLAVAAISRPHFVGYDVRALPHPAPRLARLRGPLLAGIVSTPSELAVAREHADNFVFEGLRP